MAQSNLIPVNQILIVDQVADVIVQTPPIDGGTGTGTFVRAIQIFGAPNGTNGPPVFTLMIKSTTAANLDISTPTLSF